MLFPDDQPVIAIYMATDRDETDVRRLAALDSAPVPTGRILLGVVDGIAHAAISIDTGAVVADPFRHTADLVDLLMLRAERIRRAEDPLSAAPPRLLDGLRHGARGARAGLRGQAAGAARLG